MIVPNSGPTLPTYEDDQLALLCACCWDAQILPDVQAMVGPKNFTGARRPLFSILCRLYADGEELSPSTLLAAIESMPLRKDQAKAVGDLAAYVLTEAFTAAGWRHNARKLKKAELHRAIYDAGYALLEAAQTAEADPAEALDQAESILSSVSLNGKSQTVERIDDLMRKALEDVDQRRRGTRDERTITTGYPDVETIAGEWRRGEMTVLAARPGMGKTAFGLSLAINAARAGKSVLVVSLEVSGLDLAERVLAGQARVNSVGIRNGTLSDDEFARAVNALGGLDGAPMFVADNHTSNLQRIVSECRRLRVRYGLDMLVVDYLGLVTPPNTRLPRHEQVGELTRGFKRLALDFQIPVLLLSQLNRELEKRANPFKRPQLSDLRDSGSVEQDADNVWFLYRGYEYGEEIEEDGGKRLLEEHEAELIVGKQRKGPTGVVDLRWSPELSMFDSLAREHGVDQPEYYHGEPEDGF